MLSLFVENLVAVLSPATVRGETFEAKITKGPESATTTMHAVV